MKPLSLLIALLSLAACSRPAHRADASAPPRLEPLPAEQAAAPQPFAPADPEPQPTPQELAAFAAPVPK